jgi:hypothetical protein
MANGGNAVTIQGVQMSRNAALNVEAVNLDVAEDLNRVRSGSVTREQLLNECFDGSEDETRDDNGESIRDGWRDYVAALWVLK